MKIFRPYILPIACIFAIFYSFITAALVLANNGPHGNYSATTDACASCHRAHTAQGAKLLAGSIPNLCYTCHGSSGAGADTNAVDGIYLERDSTTESPAEGVGNRGLRGGGFSNAIMDTNSDGVAASASVTSSHEGNMGTMWGNGAIGLGAGASFNLTCDACHNPHGGGYYRSLRAIPTGSGVTASVSVTDETQKNYTIASSTGNYFNENYSIANSLTNWCGQCHTRYQAASGSGHTDSGDSIFAYRHSTSSVPCVKCHVAHGSSATMGANSGAVSWPGGVPGPSGNNRSSLLRMDNRRVCYACHVKSDGTISGEICMACHIQSQGSRRPIAGAHNVNGQADESDCIGCHDNSSHQGGTVNLHANYVMADYNQWQAGNGDYQLCWTCHDENYIVEQNNAFGNLHKKHVKGEDSPCIICHDAHGPYESGEHGSINFEYPVQNGYDISYSVGGEIRNANDSFWISGNKGYCYIACHGKDHKPKEYGRQP